ncbi:MAG: saccharopine dehydrogenase NADP-binding domain-containing protein [Cytophagales bacterium]|nr:saccharopine dehydrogenase NADP-binding domain-containing protein [Cytophagales bacterium]
MKKVIVLGAGLVGKTMAIDLAKNFDVTAVDINEQALSELSNEGVKTKKVDLANTTVLTNLLKPFDLVIGAVPGFMGFKTCKTVIEAGKNMVDISFS